MGIEETLINTSEEKSQNRVRLLILCGPSGVGKSTIIAELCKHDPNLARVNAITDRPPRELDTKVCISPEEYDKLESNGEFAFSHSVYGYRYGNKKSDISKALDSKRTVIMDFPLEYVESFTSFFNVPTKIVFIRPPSLKELRHRLSERPERYEKAIEDIKKSRNIKYKKLIDEQIINKDIERVVQRLEAILHSNS